ncbi:unnamed protein product [Larinioides sclopetarius]|uniref:Uncharacterized protein n=1 Tax=Larinioides sclopetarius TaxID=280406 RepID=A0AAV1ZM02_9ARAC
MDDGLHLNACCEVEVSGKRCLFAQLLLLSCPSDSFACKKLHFSSYKASNLKTKHGLQHKTSVLTFYSVSWEIKEIIYVILSLKRRNK